jgi:apolipoprotein N-acyltransferase
LTKRLSDIAFSGIAAPLIAGGVLWLSFPPVSLWFLAPVGAGLFLFSLLRAPSFARAAAAVFLAKTVFSLLMSFQYLYGIWPPVWLLYALNYGLVWAAFGAVFHGVRRWKGEIAAVAAAPFLWVLFDRFTPCAHFLPSDISAFANALCDSPLLGLAPYLGVCGLSFLPIGLACAFLLALRAREASERRAALLGAGILVFCAALLPGMISLGAAKDGGPARTIRFISAHLREDGGDSSWAGAERVPLEPGARAAFIRYVGERLEDAAGRIDAGKAQLILLPEDAVDLILARDRSQEVYERWGLEDNGALIEAYRAFARRTGASLSVGLSTLRGGRRRNTVLLIGPDGDISGVSDKYRLAAGSERWPLAFLGYWKLFPRGADSRFVSFYDQYVPGSEPYRMLSFAGMPFGAPMCLEGHSAGMGLGWKRRGAQFLVLSSNAQWFHSGPETYNRQVLGLLRLQAGAYALPILMTGRQSYLGWVDERGQVSAVPGFGRGPSAQAVLMEARIHPDRQTAVSRRGEYFVPLSLLGVILAPFLVGSARGRAAPGSARSGRREIV